MKNIWYENENKRHTNDRGMKYFQNKKITFIAYAVYAITLCKSECPELYLWREEGKIG